MTPTAVDVRRADERFHTDAGWLDSHHSFSFGPHFDPDNIGHGLLVVSNDDHVAPGAGFGTHAHRDMEIVTWVLEGALEHRDSAGHDGVIRPGLAQRMSAGRGIQHSEVNHSATEPVMWVVPDVAGIDPGYEQRDVGAQLDAGGLVPVASGRGHDGAIAIHQAGAVLWAARLDEGDLVQLPDAPFVHLFVARGEVELDGTPLREGDAARLTSAGVLPVRALGPAELLVWETHARAHR